ncbi:MAG: PD40 domain-containing protein [Paludibacteraceae bacterium]|nr:PD40 domain-containing protein [Paludibacteraceae bacterium]
MRKTILLVAIALVSMIAQAQVLKVVSMQKVTTSNTEGGTIVGISPKGDYLLITDANERGLQRYDLATKKLTTITKEDGAGAYAKISQDGSTITYRKRIYDSSKLVRFDVMQYNAQTRKASVVAKQQAGTEMMVDVKSQLTVSVNTDLYLVLNRNGKRVVMAPNGNEYRYNWPSISPDGSKILYYVSGKGCYVCDINGKNVKFIARNCRAAQWYNNNTIVGMADEDDGHDFTASALVVYTLDGKSQTLVTKDKLAMYPHVAKGKVAFSTPKGEMYLLTVK